MQDPQNTYAGRKKVKEQKHAVAVRQQHVSFDVFLTINRPGSARRGRGKGLR